MNKIETEAQMTQIFRSLKTPGGACFKVKKSASIA